MKFLRLDARTLLALTLALAVAADIILGMAGAGDGWLSPLAGPALLFGAFGHCDGMDGPVVAQARRALETGNVNLVLPWVRESDEARIGEAFAHALAVRKLGPEARDLADLHFFETLVRVHRAGEGEPFTGLKPAGRDLGPAIPAADKALAEGRIDRLEALLTEAVRRGVRQRYQRALAHKSFAPDDVRAGREYVEAYVPFVHYVERLWEDAAGPGSPHHGDESGAAAAHRH